MKKILTLMIILTALVFAGCDIYIDFPAWDLNYSRNTSQSFSVPAANKVIVENSTGNVKVYTTEDAEVLVEATIKTRYESQLYEAGISSTDTGTLTIESYSGSLPGTDVQFDITVYVPVGMIVSVDNTTGNVEIDADIYIDDITVTTGEVSVSRAYELEYAEVTTGQFYSDDIDILHTVYVVTGSLDVSITDDSCNKSLTVVTGDSTVRVEYGLDLGLYTSVATGSIDIDWSQSSFAAYSIDAKVSTGSLDVVTR